MFDSSLQSNVFWNKSPFQFIWNFHAGWFFITENSEWKNTINFHFLCGQKKKKEKNILKQHYISNTANLNFWNLSPRAALIWFQLFFFYARSLKQLSFGFKIPGNCLTSSINNFTSRILSDFEVDDWIVEMFREESSDFLLAYSNNK